MKYFSRALCLALLVLTAVAFLLPAAHADTYTVYNLGNDNGYYLYGISNTGAVVTVQESSGACMGVMGAACYDTWVNGHMVSATLTAPDLTWDNGTACSAIPSGFSAEGTLCNNGYVGFSATGINGQEHNVAYAGPIGSPVALGSGYADQDALNSTGDFVWVDARDEFFFEAVDTSVSQVPEPSSLMLLGTGVLSLAAGLRRRVR